MRITLFILHFTILILQCASSAGAQGNCNPAEAEAFLDAGNVRARIFNDGGLFYRNGSYVYNVPKNDTTHAVFSSSIWVSGMVDGTLRLTGTQYQPASFWPGPLDSAGNPPADCKPYDNIWEINAKDLADFFASNRISDNLANWPWKLGAPVIDGDGNPDNYNLEGGDLPELLGDQRLWWIMNDLGNTRDMQSLKAVGLEVHASTFAFAHPGSVGNQTFFTYRLINKNITPLTRAHFSIYADADLGNFNDDYMGSDSLLNTGYFYNADDFDEKPGGYGPAPPAIGFTYLKTGIADTNGLDDNNNGTVDESEEMTGLSSFIGFGHSLLCDICDYPREEDFYYILQGRWEKDHPMYLGEDGFWQSSLDQDTTHFLFSGDPVTGSFWSELNLDGTGRPNWTHDRRAFVSTGPFTLLPNDTLDIAFAITWARGKDHLDSITELRKQIRSTFEAIPAILTPRTAVNIPFTSAPPQHSNLGFDQNFPNPFSSSTTIRYSLPQSMRVRLAIYDVLGREVELLVDTQQDAGIYTLEFDAGNLPAGIYFARIELDHLRFTKRMVLAR